MNAIKTYFIAKRKKGQVEYGSAHGGKWTFRVGKYSKITKVAGGKPVADKIAEAFHKSWLRTDGKKVENDCERIDAICRRVIDRLIKVRTIADWKPDVDWWSNEPGDEPSVKMITPVNRSEETIPWHQAPKGIGAEDLVVDPPVVPAEPETANA